MERCMKDIGIMMTQLTEFLPRRMKKGRLPKVEQKRVEMEENVGRAEKVGKEEKVERDERAGRDEDKLLYQTNLNIC